jgi:hypothetical protein
MASLYPLAFGLSPRAQDGMPVVTQHVALGDHFREGRICRLRVQVCHRWLDMHIRTDSPS